VLSSTDTGNTCLDGFVNATRDKDSRSSEPSTSLEANDRPGCVRPELAGTLPVEVTDSCFLPFCEP